MSEAAAKPLAAALLPEALPPPGPPNGTTHHGPVGADHLGYGGVT